ncbi:MAG TPA: type IV secretory system conjugative DNA transfer family protein, partial [Mycobacterium sp.]|nr:type IV secretory system conjugative DNA transfer family protein [Mycobacterium sp.]
MRIDYEPADSAAPADVAKVVIKIPRAVLPSKIIDRCKEVLTETLSGAKKKKWKASIADTVITFTPKVEIQDPPALKHLKSVLQDNRALGAEARIDVNECDDAGQIAVFTAKASKPLANMVASRIRQVYIEQLVHTRVPIANGSWVVTWDVTGVPTMTVRRSAFRDKIYKPPPERFIQSRAQAAEAYPNAVFRQGLHPDGRVCTRTPIKEANGLTTGPTGKGKTTYLHNELIDAAAWGFIIIIVDGKFSDSYVGFRDWPGVQIVANDMYTAIRAVFYVAEMLSRRQDGGRSGEFPVDNNTPVLFIVDEYADLVTRIQTEVWDIYKGKDKDLPNLCPAITVLERLPQMIRQFRIHMDTGTQKPDSKRISQNIIFNSDKKSQWGEMSGAQSQAYWGDYNTGPSVPPIAGRGVIKTIDGNPEPLQGYFA